MVFPRARRQLYHTNFYVATGACFLKVFRRHLLGIWEPCLHLCCDRDDGPYFVDVYPSDMESLLATYSKFPTVSDGGVLTIAEEIT